MASLYRFGTNIWHWSEILVGADVLLNDMSTELLNKSSMEYNK